MRRISLAVLAGLVGLCAAVPGADGFGVYGIKQNASAAFDSISSDGRYVAFETLATNLGPGDSDSLYDVYVRDTQTGVIALASRATGAAGSKVNSDARYPSISGDGRFVTFTTAATNLDPIDTDAVRDTYVRDLVNQTTTLVTRATGASGVKANGDATDAEISADGRYVVWASYANNIASVPVTDMNVHVRDLQANTTTLVSRPDGAASPSRNGREPSVADGGRYVAFTSTSSTLTPDDLDNTNDVFVRDLVSNTTTLVSRATGAAGAKGNGYSGTPSISADGSAVGFHSAATTLSPDDTDSTGDAYLRDLAAQTTVLASRATGAAGAKANGLSFPNIDHSLSADGSKLVFESRATNLDAADGETFPDVYMRDVDAGTTQLVSRTAANTNSNLAATVPSLSSNGRYVSFTTGSTNMTPDDTDSLGDVYVRDVVGGATYLESRCCPGYARPKGASPTRVALVPAQEPCTAPDRTHGAPLAHGSCSSPQPVSDHATIGTPDVNGKLLKGGGFVSYQAVPGDPLTGPDEADVAIQVSMLDVRDSATLNDYAGELEARVGIRLSDRSNGAAAAETGTMEDRDFSVAAPCSGTADTTIGATCAVVTTADAVLPGVVKEGARAVWDLGQVRVFDGGPDADADTVSGNTLFAVQGIFVP